MSEEEWEGGDATRGAKLFKYQCAKCHTIGMNTLNKIGPTLWNIYGSKSGSNKTYRYSTSLAQANIEWTGPTLYAFLEDPKTFLPGSKMAYLGLTKAEDRRDIIAYLKNKQDPWRK